MGFPMHGSKYLSIFKRKEWETISRLSSLQPEKSSWLEEKLLIEEIRKVVELKGLNITITEARKPDAQLEQLNLEKFNDLVRACPSCIACTCMICW